MAHMVETMAYAGETPWHGLGVRVADLSPEDMKKAAGLDWQVEKTDVYYRGPDGKFHLIKSKSALVRDKDGQFLDIVSKNWQPVQNEQAFEFFEEFTKSGGMTMETAGSLDNGRMVWALAKLSGGFSVNGKDDVEPYLLLSNPHQFGKAVDIRFTPIRVVCNNTLALSMRSGRSAFRSLHSSSFDPKTAARFVKEADKMMATYKETAEFLTSKRYNQRELFRFFNEVFPRTSGADSRNLSDADLMAAFRNKDKSIISRNAIQAFEVIETQPGAKMGEGTWWGAYNTVTYMTNHLVGRNVDTRLKSLWFGQNKARNINALGKALEYAQAA